MLLCFYELMKLLHDYVAIKADELEEKTNSGIYIPNQIKTPPPTGVVKYVGDKVTEVKVGDHVIYKVYASVDIDTEPSALKDETKLLSIIPISGVLAIIS